MKPIYELRFDLEGFYPEGLPSSSVLISITPPLRPISHTSCRYIFLIFFSPTLPFSIRSLPIFHRYSRTRPSPSTLPLHFLAIHDTAPHLKLPYSCAIIIYPPVLLPDLRRDLLRHQPAAAQQHGRVHLQPEHHQH